MGKVMKPKIIHKNHVNTIEQKIGEVHSGTVKVLSKNGKEYHVELSDRVKMTMTPVKGDIAIIKTFPNGWLVTDIKKQVKEEVLTAEEELAETQRQLKELEDIGWGEY